MSSLIMLKKTTGTEPFKYYVFFERDAGQLVADIIMKDTLRYDVVIKVESLSGASVDKLSGGNLDGLKVINQRGEL